MSCANELRALSAVAQTQMQSEKNFFSMMSHELRTPLNSILNMHRFMLDDKDKLSENQLDFLNTSFASAEELLCGKITLKTCDMCIDINNLLDYAKYYSKDVEVVAQNFNVVQVMESILDIVQARASKAKANVILQYDNAAMANPIVVADKDRIRQVMGNVIYFCIKQSVRNGNVQARVTIRNKSSLNIEIQYQGAKLSKDSLRCLFDPLCKASNSIADNSLALPLVKRIVDAMKGTIQVSPSSDGAKFEINIPAQFIIQSSSAFLRSKEIWILDYNYCQLEALKQYCNGLSDRVRIFSTALPSDIQNPALICLLVESSIVSSISESVLNQFAKVAAYGFTDELSVLQHRTTMNMIWITKPIKYSALLDALESTTLPIPTRNINSTILVVEDNIVNQKVLCTMLAKLEKSFVVANNAKEALEAAYKYNPTCILMDLHLPDGNGYDVAEQLRSDHLTCSLVACSAISVQEFRENAKFRYFDGFLAKPIAFPLLKQFL